MPTKPTKGKAQFATQLRAELLDQFREYARGRGETLSAALERAMTREMAYPPPIPEPQIEPLPDAPPAPTAERGANSHTKRKT
jgi:hypothetical protein